MNGKGDKARNNFSKDWYGNYEQICWRNKKENRKNPPEVWQRPDLSKMRPQLKEDIENKTEDKSEELPLTS